MDRFDDLLIGLAAAVAVAFSRSMKSTSASGKPNGNPPYRLKFMISIARPFTGLCLNLKMEDH